MIRRGIAVHVVALVLLAGLAGLPVMSARARVGRQAHAAAVNATVARLPSGDFSLAGSGRHLRHVSLTEPGAAFADVTAGPDGDPAGGALAPPAAVWAESESVR